MYMSMPAALSHSLALSLALALTLTLTLAQAHTHLLAPMQVHALYDYVDVQEGFDVLNYNLVSNFPHCVYEGEKREMTLSEAGLAGAMLMIQSLDD